MKYSFVIPTYKNKKLLRNLLETLNNQKGFGREDYEAVVIDDGSGDDTYEYIKGINRNYELKYIYLERCADSCRSRTRNAGWKNAKGEVVIFIDADALVREDYLHEVERCYSLDKEIVLTGLRLNLLQDVSYEDVCSAEVFNKHAFSPQGFDFFEIRHFLLEGFSYNSTYNENPWLMVYSCNMCVPRKVLEKTGGFDEGYKGWGMEDVDLGYAAYCEGLKVIINSKLEILHQFHGNTKIFAVEEKNRKEYDENLERFMQKYYTSLALRMPENMIYEIFKTERMLALFSDNTPKDTRVLKLTNKEVLNDIKQEIISLSDQEGLDIVVEDYVEDTDIDIDIWIQLLGRRKSTPKYFEASRRLDLQKMFEFIMRNAQMPG